MEMQKFDVFVKEILIIKILRIQKYCKARDCCYYTGECRGAAQSICNLKCNVPNEMPIVFHNESNYDYNFIIIELAKIFERQFNFRRKH